jgi:hypothetical protein
MSGVTGIRCKAVAEGEKHGRQMLACFPLSYAAARHRRGLSLRHVTARKNIDNAECHMVFIRYLCSRVSNPERRKLNAKNHQWDSKDRCVWVVVDCVRVVGVQ